MEALVGDEIAQPLREFQLAVRTLVDQLLDPWLLVQLVIAAVLVIASRFLGGIIE